ncbi:MAG TPA: hypothetical protein VM689_18665 [Aliidongia sp.]|nr:hypothetical protein [Aliidongia sp.]
MLTISNAQLKRFDEIRREQFLDRLAEVLREDFPDETSALTPDDLDIVVAIIAHQAEGFDITSEDSIFVYTVMAICFGMNFHEHPAIEDALLSGDPPADEAILQVPSLLNAEDIRDLLSNAQWPDRFLREIRADSDNLSAPEA